MADNSRRARLDILTYPKEREDHGPEREAVSGYPILVEIERNMVSYRTRAKLQAYGSRPHRGILVIVLYGRPRHDCPEATETICLHHKSQLTKSRQERSVGNVA